MKLPHLLLILSAAFVMPLSAQAVPLRPKTGIDPAQGAFVWIPAEKTDGGLPASSAFYLGGSKGFLGPASNPSDGNGFLNEAGTIFAVNHQPATKESHIHLFLRSKEAQLLHLADINRKVAPLLPAADRAKALGFLRVNRISGRVLDIEGLGGKPVVRVEVSDDGNLKLAGKNAPAAVATGEWSQVEIPGVATLSVPPSMEVQNESIKMLNELLFRSLKLPQGHLQVMLQQKGLNKADPNALKTFARLIFQVFAEDEDLGHSLGDPLAMSAEDLEILTETTIANLKAEAVRLKAEGSLVAPEYVQFGKARVKSMKCGDAVLMSYQRKSTSTRGLIQVHTYTFFDRRKTITVTTSHPVAEADRFEKGLEEAVSRIRFSEGP